MMEDNKPLNVQVTSKETPTLLNTDRLRLHLKEDGLAVALLDVWLDDPKLDNQARMLQIIDSYHKKKQVNDG
ncbi:MAG: hypothetical protein OEZ32_00625 [Nitrospinota bacterium]|nr:hypothetical protein [Nitrospinota bacterium]